ncbi:hypothetical protein H0W91_01490 [Patescibacteria group bacterium]|nr:hypothetical protein [Patescibacteria group bacterium]
MLSLSKVESLFSSDIIFLVSLFILFLAYAMYFGKGRIVSVMLAFYPAALLYNNFPFLNKLLFLHGASLVTLNKVLIFLIFLLPLNIIINKYIFVPLEFSGGTGMLRTAGFALASLVLFVLFTYTVVNLDTIHNFSPTIDALFKGSDRIFYANLIPLVLLASL